MSGSDVGEERPRCSNCGHRRVFHYRMIGSTRRHQATETPAECSVWVNADADRCGCLHYHPMPWVRAT